MTTKDARLHVLRIDLIEKIRILDLDTLEEIDQTIKRKQLNRKDE